MELNVIYGQLDAYCTFYYVVILHFTEMMIKKFYKWFRKESSTLMEKSGMILQKKPKIWLKNLFANQKKDWLLKKL